MSDLKVSYRYASSFLAEVIDSGNLQKVSEDVALINTTLKQNPELRAVLASPIVKSDTKQSILEELFKNKTGKETMQFISFIVKKGREAILYKILSKFLELRDEHLGVVNAEIKTAIELDDEQTKLLVQSLENFIKKKVNIKLELDKEILGGFIAKIGDTIVDASLKHQLSLLKKQFLKGGPSLN